MDEPESIRKAEIALDAMPGNSDYLASINKMNNWLIAIPSTILLFVLSMYETLMSGCKPDWYLYLYLYIILKTSVIIFYFAYYRYLIYKSEIVINRIAYHLKLSDLGLTLDDMNFPISDKEASTLKDDEIDRDYSVLTHRFGFETGKIYALLLKYQKNIWISIFPPLLLLLLFGINMFI
jgi:hypothetical protein